MKRHQKYVTATDVGELQVEDALWFIREGGIFGWRPSWLKPEDLLVFDWEVSYTP